MRTKAEIRLLMVRQNIKDAMDVLRSETVVDINKYRILEAKFKAVQHFLIKLRRKELRLRKSAI